MWLEQNTLESVKRDCSGIIYFNLIKMGFKRQISRPTVEGHWYFSRKPNFLSLFLSTVTSKHVHLLWIIQEKIKIFLQLLPDFLMGYHWRVYMKGFMGEICHIMYMIKKQKTFSNNSFWQNLTKISCGCEFVLFILVISFFIQYKRGQHTE